jgi:hypothetical protein
VATRELEIIAERTPRFFQSLFDPSGAQQGCANIIGKKVPRYLLTDIIAEPCH